MSKVSLVVIYKPHGTRVAIRPQEFDSKIHEKIVEGKEYKPEEKDRELTLEESSLDELNAEFFELGKVRATGAHRTNRVFLISRIQQMREENRVLLETQRQKVAAPVQPTPDEKPKKDEVEDTVDSDSTSDDEDLVSQYEKAYGKKPIGKWAKDKEWLTKKINDARK